MTILGAMSTNTSSVPSDATINAFVINAWVRLETLGFTHEVPSIDRATLEVKRQFSNSGHAPKASLVGPAVDRVRALMSAALYEGKVA